MIQIIVNRDAIMQGAAKLATNIIADLRTDLEKKKVNASGRFSKSLNYEIINTGSIFVINIKGYGYFPYIEKGRGASTKKGTTPLYVIIRQWIKDKGISYEKGMEYAIANSIHKKGTAMYRGQGYYKNPITGTINSDSIIKKAVEVAFTGIELITVKPRI